MKKVDAAYLDDGANLKPISFYEIMYNLALPTKDNSVSDNNVGTSSSVHPEITT